MVTRIVINTRYGGFSLSEEACKVLNCDFEGRNIKRSDPRLLDLMDLLGSKYCSGKYAELTIAEIPDSWDGCWKMEEFDGYESVEFDGESWFVKQLIGRDKLTKKEIAKILNTYQAIRDG